MEGREISTICQTKRAPNASKYKNLVENAARKGEDFPTCPETRDHSPREKCVEEKTPGQLRDEVSDTVLQDDENSAPVPVDECHPPLETWTRLPELTGTRPTVDNFTIARYSPGEYEKHQNHLSDTSEHKVREAKNLDYKGRLLESQMCKKIDDQQFDNSVLLTERAGTIFYWKTELNLLSNEIAVEIEKIQNEIKRLSNCFRAVEIIRDMNRDVQKIRNMRMNTDLVHDNLADEIIKESKLCREILNVYTRCIDETKMQLTELKNAKQRVEYDWSDKEHTYAADCSCIGLDNASEILQWKPGCVRHTQDQSSSESHESFSKETILYAKTALNRSELLRANMKKTTNKAVKDLKEQAALVEMALADQIGQHLEDCRNLEKSLQSCVKRLSDNELMINKKNTTIRRLDGPMKCAQTRLDIRSTRENVESCRDESQFALVDEVKNISESVAAFLGHVKSTEESTEALLNLRKIIENEIIIKRKSLWIDGERCRLMRLCYPPNHVLSGYQCNYSIN